VETNQFQQLLMIPFAQVVARENIDLALCGIDNQMNKQVRIRRWGAPLGQRRVRFRNTPGTRIALAQFQDFPAGEHDDGPDAGGLNWAGRNWTRATRRTLPTAHWSCSWIAHG